MKTHITSSFTLHLNLNDSKQLDLAIEIQKLIRSKQSIKGVGPKEINKAFKIETIEQLEDEEDIKESDKIIERVESGEEETISLEELEQKLIEEEFKDEEVEPENNPITAKLLKALLRAFAAKGYKKQALDLLEEYAKSKSLVDVDKLNEAKLGLIYDGLFELDELLLRQTEESFEG